MRTTKSDIGNVIRAGEPRFADIDLEQFTESEMRKVAHNFGVDLSALTSSSAPGITGTTPAPAVPAGATGGIPMTTPTPGRTMPDVCKGERLTRVRKRFQDAGFLVSSEIKEADPTVKKGRVIRVDQGSVPEIVIPVVSEGSEGETSLLRRIIGDPKDFGKIEIKS